METGSCGAGEISTRDCSHSRIGMNDDPSKFIRVEYPTWGDASHNNGTLQGTTIYAGAPAWWQNLPAVSQGFGYDTVNRLISASESGAWSQTYGYDEFGNMWIPPSSAPLSLADMRRLTVS